LSTLTLAPLALDRVDGESTLDDLLMGVWEGLSIRRAVRCPVCAGEMVRIETAGELGGHCGDCGSTLS
jgi:hypothetical protein